MVKHDTPDPAVRLLDDRTSADCRRVLFEAEITLFNIFKHRVGMNTVEIESGLFLPCFQCGAFPKYFAAQIAETPADGVSFQRRKEYIVIRFDIGAFAIEKQRLIDLLIYTLAIENIFFQRNIVAVGYDHTHHGGFDDGVVPEYQSFAGKFDRVIAAPDNIVFHGYITAVAGRKESASQPAQFRIRAGTQGGIAVNPKNVELTRDLKAAGLPIIDIHELKEKTERITGAPAKLPKGDRVVADVISRDGDLLDQIYNVPQK